MRLPLLAAQATQVPQNVTNPTHLPGLSATAADASLRLPLLASQAHTSLSFPHLPFYAPLSLPFKLHSQI